jgi:transcriptional regulator with GAF, ATPase, and Fis domain
VHIPFEFRRKLLQLEALYDIGRALSSLRPEQELIEELLQRAIAVLDASIGFAFSLDGERQVRHVYSIGIAELSDPDAILESEPVSRVLAIRTPLSTSVPAFFGERGGAVLIAPLISGDELIGALGVIGKEERGEAEGSFVEDDLRFIASLAAIAAAAIDNSRSFAKLNQVRQTLESENRSLREHMRRDYSDRLMIGDSPEMQRVIDLVARVSESQANVMIRGESGTGKELVARLVHLNSPRRDEPFIAINCAALPETLLESELFGIERGVATGVEARPGKFEMAQGGTVFLDEIGDIPITLQAKLLRVLQEREIEKLGGRRKIKVDVRILTATHRNLEAMIGRSEFRQDLYYRLRVVEIVLPPLRARRQDIPKLVRYFLDRYGKREGRGEIAIAPDALDQILRYPFPGNVRELENLIEGAVALARGTLIELADLHLPEVAAHKEPVSLGEGLPTLRELELRYVARVLEQTGGNMSRASRILGVDRKTLYRWRTEMGQIDTSDPSWYIN